MIFLHAPVSPMIQAIETNQQEGPVGEVSISVSQNFSSLFQVFE